MRQMLLLGLFAAASIALSFPGAAEELPNLTLIAPVPYETFQRKPVGTGSIFLKGTSSGGDIEASFCGGPWSRVARNTLPGAWSGELAVQPATQGLLEVRLKAHPEIGATVAMVGIGDVYGIAGQSNAVGAGDTLHVSENPVFTGTMLGLDGVWQPCVDPVGGNKGSVWPLVATSLMASRGVPIAFIPCAVGGTSIAEWLPGADHYDPATLYGAMAVRCKRPGGIKSLLWWQGEKDVGLGTTQADYYARGAALAFAVQADLRCKLTVAKLQTEPLRPAATQAAIRAAHSQMWTNPNCLPGPDLVGLICDGGFHLVLDEKVRAAADLWAAAL